MFSVHCTVYTQKALKSYLLDTELWWFAFQADLYDVSVCDQQSGFYLVIS